MLFLNLAFESRWRQIGFRVGNLNFHSASASLPEITRCCFAGHTFFTRVSKESPAADDEKYPQSVVRSSDLKSSSPVSTWEWFIEGFCLESTIVDDIQLSVMTKCLFAVLCE